MKILMKGFCFVFVALLLSSLILSGCNTADTTTTVTTGTTKATTTAQTTTESTTAETSSDIAEFVKLKYYFIGDEGPDTITVWDEINKIAKEKINTEIELGFVSWSDFATKYNLLYFSGEEFDMAYTAVWAFYQDTAEKGGLWEITQERLEQYAPDILKYIPEEAFKGVRIGGKVYMIPHNDPGLYAYSIAIRGDLMEKYNILEINSSADIENFMDIIAKNETEILPFADANPLLSNVTAQWFYDAEYRRNTLPGAPGMYYSPDDPTGKLISPYDDPNYLVFARKMLDFRTRGFWSQSAITSSQGTYDDQFKAGKGAVTAVTVDGANTLALAYPEWNVICVDMTWGQKVNSLGYLYDGTAINAKSKNPERALMFANLTIGDPDIYRLINYGIKGTHYEVDSNGMRTMLPEAENVGGYSIWNIRNTELDIPVGGNAPWFDEMMDSLKSRRITHPLTAITFDLEAYKTEIATASQIWTEYHTIFCLGFADDVDAKYAEMKTKLDEIGYPELMAEIQRQATEWCANY